MLKQPPEARDAFRTARDELNRAFDRFLRDLRNELSVHLDVSRVQEGLNSVGFDQEGIAQLGRTRQDIHHRFALELLWSAILWKSPNRAFEDFDTAAVGLRAWEGHYNHERFSLALQGRTPAEKLAMLLSASAA